MRRKCRRIKARRTGKAGRRAAPAAREEQEMKQKLKLALVGAGERGQYCYAPYAKMHGYEIEFVAVADPHKGRREKFVQDYHVPAEGVFETAEQFFARPRMADAVLICTQDSQHYAYACQAIDLGYSILLEKPISPSVRECLDLQRRAEEKGTQIMVCHVMRYTKFYRKLKELIDSGVIGDVVHVTHTENVAYWHYAHSYVRGNWHKTADSSPMILAKCCHDMDILSWLLGSRCRTVSSFGDLRYFREENAPAAAPPAAPTAARTAAPAHTTRPRCTWTTIRPGHRADGPGAGPRAMRRAKRRWRKAPTVSACSTTTTMWWIIRWPASCLENGTTVAFTMCAFSDACDRTVKFMGTRGEIRASMDNNVIEVTQFGAGVRTGTTAVYTVKPGSTGHSGGDEGIMEEFVSILKGERENTNTIAQSVHSHVMAFAAEESRLTGRTVDVADFEKSVMA